MNITVTAKEWFDKANGNSYFSARIEIDSKLVAMLPYQYGYGDQYIHEANAYLAEHGYIINPRSANGSRTPLWSYCETHGIHLEIFKQTRCLKCELDKVVSVADYGPLSSINTQ